MNPRLFTFLLSAIATSAIAAGETANTSAVSSLRKAQPEVRWIEKTMVATDVTCDGKPDRIAIGYGKDKSVWVGVIQSGARPRE